MGEGEIGPFIKQLRGKYRLSAILSGDMGWPRRPDERDVLYFLAQSFRAQLLKELPADGGALAASQRELAHRGKALIKELAAISLELAQIVVAKQGEGDALPAWFLVEVVRDLPRLVAKSDGA